MASAIYKGVYKPDAGSIAIDGQVVEIKNPIQARIHATSELCYIPEITVRESLFVGRPFERKLWSSEKKRSFSIFRPPS